MLELAFAMAPPPDGADSGSGSLACFVTADDHDVFDLLFYSDSAATEKATGSSKNVG